MRIGIIGLQHESNTFVPTLTTMENFQREVVATGQGVRDFYASLPHEIGGFFASVEAAGDDSVVRHDALILRVPFRHIQQSNSAGRDHIAGTSPPGHYTGCNRTLEHWAASATKADEGWILTRLSAIMSGMCESTVWGAASVLTAKSKLTLCLSPRHLLAYACLTSASSVQARFAVNPSAQSTP